MAACGFNLSLALRRIWCRMSLLITIIFCSCKGQAEEALSVELRPHIAAEPGQDPASGGVLHHFVAIPTRR